MIPDGNVFLFLFFSRLLLVLVILVFYLSSRSLPKVQWDESSPIMLSDRVCPWKIQPSASSTSIHSSLVSRWKKPRADHLPSSPDLSTVGRDGKYFIVEMVYKIRNPSRRVGLLFQ